MIIKKRSKPLILQQYEAIIPRLRKNFPRLPEIQFEAAKSYKGYMGEKKVDYHLSFLAEKFTLLQDVCLFINGRASQMDNIVITPHAIYIIEVKNYSGTIVFDTLLNQFMREDGEQIEGFNHPITQVENQQLQLMAWLQDKNLPAIPIHYFIAISDPTTKIKVIGNTEAIAATVVHGEQLPKRILTMEEESHVSNPFQHQKLGHAILRESKEFDKNIMPLHGIKPADLLPGVRCPECTHLGMAREYGRWRCPSCNLTNKIAHKQTILDYLLCVNPTISNRECKQLLQVNSRNLCTRLLKSSNLIYVEKLRRWKKD